MSKVLEKARARRYRKEGKSIKEIARLLGVSSSSVSIWCADLRLTSA
jgi:transposase